MKKEMQMWEAFHRIYKSQDYQEFLKPYLEKAFYNTWMNPSELNTNGDPKFPDEKSFHKAYSEQYFRAIAYKELFNMLSSAASVVENYAKQIKSPEKNYEI